VDYLLKHHNSWILLLSLPLSILRHLEGVIFICGFSHYSVLPFFLSWQKGGLIFYLDRDCIFNRSSDFCPRMAKGRVY